jgi:hypothetical protein
LLTITGNGSGQECPLYTLFEFVLEMVFDHVEEVCAIVGAANAVRLIGIDHEAELLVCLD